MPGITAPIVVYCSLGSGMGGGAAAAAAVLPTIFSSFTKITAGPTFLTKVASSSTTSLGSMFTKITAGKAISTKSVFTASGAHVPPTDPAAAAAAANDTSGVVAQSKIALHKTEEALSNFGEHLKFGTKNAFENLGKRTGIIKSTMFLNIFSAFGGLAATEKKKKKNSNSNNSRIFKRKKKKKMHKNNNKEEKEEEENEKCVNTSLLLSRRVKLSRVQDRKQNYEIFLCEFDICESNMSSEEGYSHMESDGEKSNNYKENALRKCSSVHTVSTCNSCNNLCECNDVYFDRHEDRCCECCKSYAEY